MKSRVLFARPAIAWVGFLLLAGLLGGCEAPTVPSEEPEVENIVYTNAPFDSPWFQKWGVDEPQFLTDLAHIQQTWCEQGWMGILSRPSYTGFTVPYAPVPLQRPSVSLGSLFEDPEIHVWWVEHELGHPSPESWRQLENLFRGSISVETHRVGQQWFASVRTSDSGPWASALASKVILQSDQLQSGRTQVIDFGVPVPLKGFDSHLDFEYQWRFLFCLRMMHSSSGLQQDLSMPGVDSIEFFSMEDGNPVDAAFHGKATKIRVTTRGTDSMPRLSWDGKLQEGRWTAPHVSEYTVHASTDGRPTKRISMDIQYETGVESRDVDIYYPELHRLMELTLPVQAWVPESMRELAKEEAAFGFFLSQKLDSLLHGYASMNAGTLDQPLLDTLAVIAEWSPSGKESIAQVAQTRFDALAARFQPGAEVSFSLVRNLQAQLPIPSVKGVDPPQGMAQMAARLKTVGGFLQGFTEGWGESQEARGVLVRGVLSDEERSPFRRVELDFQRALSMKFVPIASTQISVRYIASRPFSAHALRLVDGFGAARSSGALTLRDWDQAMRIAQELNCQLPGASDYSLGSLEDNLPQEWLFDGREQSDTGRPAFLFQEGGIVQHFYEDSVNENRGFRLVREIRIP